MLSIQKKLIQQKKKKRKKKCKQKKPNDNNARGRLLHKIEYKNILDPIKHDIAQAEHPWPSKEHTPLDKLQDDPKGLTCLYFHGGRTCKRNRALSEPQAQKETN